MAGLVSIITPSYNSGKFIADTILSVQAQTYPNWEMIIVDDCSTDKTPAIVSDFSAHDHRIKFYQLQKNSGAGVARQEAVLMASGRYIAFLDSDDLWKPEKLQKQIDFLQEQQLPFTFSFYECIDETGKPIQRMIKAPSKLKYWQLFFCNFVGNLTGIYDTQFFGKIPISNLRKRQDWMVWLTVLRKIKTAQPLKESLAYYRVRKDSISASKLDLLKHNYNVYHLFYGYNTFVSLCCMLGFLVMQLGVKPFYIKKLEPTSGTV
ncbi:glycosyltransferase family 2 protein [Flavobacterium sp. CYK-4]|uniref:glycosyltransferase family 2 protein n=1 Tax=Flavobacterium lotistagni TaxID=2709660 RepID=UPI001408CFB0|nr:glycosyltransferase family 2 protein [Flavobacterium lotistagni]NHM07789.1 glycosyltransferase family 2 protein [Flavobacterium lotistagni]